MPQIAPLVAGDPTRLGGFRLSGRLGEGGQGVVYLGVSESGEQAAVKLLHVKFSGDTTARSRFARELRAAQRVASFCTARVIDADLEGDTPYIASEFIQGRSLRDVVDDDGPLRGVALDRLAIGTATALTAIHRASIVHRDFKPDNVLMAVDGPRVVDFGIARILDSTGTITSRAIGTPAYMAPEQIAGDDVGPHTDIFAWGATITFAATGVTIFDGGSIAAVLNRILNHEVDLSMLHEPLRSVVRSSLLKPAASRPSADQILLRLLGRPDSAGASPDVLTQGVQIATPADDGDTTRQARMPTSTGRSGAPPPARPAPGTATGFEPPPQPFPAPQQPQKPQKPQESQPGHQQPRRQPQPPHQQQQPRHDQHSRPVPQQDPWARPAPGRDFAAESPTPALIPPPSWQTPPPGGRGGEPSTLVSAEPARRKTGKKVWAVLLAIVVLLAGGAGVAYAAGWRPPFLQASASTGGGEPRSFASVVDKAAATKTLTVGLRNFLPGISLQSTQNGSWTGFEVDLATEIAKALDVPAEGITFRETSRAERPGLLADGKVDMVIATYPVNDADDVVFAGPYYLAHVDVLVKDGSSIQTLAGLEGRRLCQPAASVSVGVVQRRVERLELVPADTYTECVNMLTAGTVDAVPGDDLVLAGFANRESVRFKVLGLKLTDERYAVALKPGDEGGCRAVRAAITALYENGVIRRLLGKHFSNVEFAPELAMPALAPCG
ncbi:hypothetical protein Misp01_06260 [Microtetraspora sp. NBRC 13810]|uniref:bifunctional serine/threonine-protein kinase/glutamate ABC transporter substrate-binding protein n=1 Tax=Microtetraspora sp. NBRC 13810 TaxID=3030990 RepID=UPI0024A25F07|nr:bifunctional serine/threonine-protein kinase/glutamate ABC transporter substrate-binding protein [Microtetraspora sp. NBRC 13810]GLW05496.1 hypothetical protein Misp01_06260 [Microtetraspora sp. NBRC 13810]